MFFTCNVVTCGVCYLALSTVELWRLRRSAWHEAACCFLTVSLLVVSVTCGVGHLWR
jgi:hypothetical protein